MGSSLLHFVMCLRENVKNFLDPGLCFSLCNMVLWLEHMDPRTFSESIFDSLSIFLSFFFSGFSLNFSTILIP